MALRCDCKLRFLRKAETGRNALNEPILVDQTIFTAWGSVGPLTRDRFELLGISGTHDAREIVVRSTSAVRGLALGDGVELDGGRFGVVGLCDRDGARRGFVSVTVSRKI